MGEFERLWRESVITYWRGYQKLQKCCQNIYFPDQDLNPQLPKAAVIVLNTTRLCLEQAQHEGYVGGKNISLLQFLQLLQELSSLPITNV
jgi:hypothetical protein